MDRLRAKAGRLAGAFVVPLAMTLLFGNFIWLNVRPDDPLPSGFERYSPEAFRAAQRAGQTVVVDVYAVWCTTCRSQQLALEGAMDGEPPDSWSGFRVDFDSDRDFLKAYGVPMQSTLIVFDGEREISRSVGLTGRAEIRGQLRSALAETRRDDQDADRGDPSWPLASIPADPPLSHRSAPGSEFGLKQGGGAIDDEKVRTRRPEAGRSGRREQRWRSRREPT